MIARTMTAAAFVSVFCAFAPASANAAPFAPKTEVAAGDVTEVGGWSRPRQNHYRHRQGHQRYGYYRHRPYYRHYYAPYVPCYTKWVLRHGYRGSYWAPVRRCSW